MRRPGARAVFYTALGIATIATIGAYRALQATRVSDSARVRPVIVLLRDVPDGAEIPVDAVRRVTWNADVVPPGAFADVDSVVGRITRAPLFAGDPVTHSRVAQPGSLGGLEVKITPGKRAMAVPINDVAGLSGLIQPNSRVDVLVTFRPDQNTPREMAKLFMQNVRVLSVGNRLQRTEGSTGSNATSATLEVTPTEAERLALAANQGTIQLVLRPFGDADSVTTQGANSRDVIGQLKAAPEVEVAKESRPTRPRASAAEVPHPIPAPVYVAPAVVPAAPAPRIERNDSLTVHVFRGSKVEQTKVGRDSIKGKPKW